MKDTPINTRYPADVLEQMKKLAQAHERSFNGEVVWALREYIQQRKPRMKSYNLIPDDWKKTITEEEWYIEEAIQQLSGGGFDGLRNRSSVQDKQVQSLILSETGKEISLSAIKAYREELMTFEE